MKTKLVLIVVAIGVILIVGLGIDSNSASVLSLTDMEQLRAGSCCPKKQLFTPSQCTESHTPALACTNLNSVCQDEEDEDWCGSDGWDSNGNGESCGSLSGGTEVECHAGNTQKCWIMYDCKCKSQPGDDVCIKKETSSTEYTTWSSGCG